MPVPCSDVNHNNLLAPISILPFPFIDTHTHIYTDDFDADRAEVVGRALEAGAQKLFLPNIDAASVEPMLRLCRQYPGLCYPMIGLHPTELPPNPQPVLDEMEQMLESRAAEFIAVGEVGIDLYWDASRREEQIAAFVRQAEWALRFGLPLMVHSRAAHRDLVEALRPYASRLTGVFHCFGGTAEEAAELLETFPGFALGIGGVVTFKKSTLAAALRAAVPLSRIVAETDAPYLAPTPHRGKRNEPAYLPLVVQKLSEIYELAPDVVAEQLLQTTKKLFPLAFSRQ